MLVVSKHFSGDALNTLRAMPPEQTCAEIPGAKGFFACRGDSVPEGYAFIAKVEDGTDKGILCQKK